MNANAHFIVFDNNGVPLANAQLKVNGQLTKYDSSTGLHIMAGEVSDKFDLEVKASGFNTIDIKGIPWAQRPHKIYLGKEGDPWYIDANGMPVAYSYRPRDIFVVLKDSNAGQSIQPVHIKTEILSLPGLEGYQLIEVDWKAGLNQMSLHHRTDNKLLLRAPANLPASHVPALASLRKNALVQLAGPLIVHGEEYGMATAIGKRIIVYPNTQKMKSYDEGIALASSLGCRYNVQGGFMEFEDDAGSVVVEAMKKIVASGLFSVVALELFQEAELFG